MKRAVSSLSMMTVMIMIFGCGESGPKRQHVSGMVKYKGQPIKQGSIGFRSDDGNSVGTADIVDGKYELVQEVGLTPGNYRVAITYPDPKVPPPSPDDAPGESKIAREMLPAKYNDNTTLTAEITEGSNDHVDFDLK